MGNPETPGEQSSARYLDYLLWLAGAAPGPRPESTPSAVNADALKNDAEIQAENAEARLATWLRANVTSLSNVSSKKSENESSRSVSSLQPAPERQVSRADTFVTRGQMSLEQLRARNDDLLRLATALDALPEDQRSLLMMKHVQGCSIAEISEQTGRSKLAVVSLLYEGVRTLRALLEQPHKKNGGTAT
jgi:RNA polymerase sigma factor (sigma-70 family)